MRFVAVGAPSLREEQEEPLGVGVKLACCVLDLGKVLQHLEVGASLIWMGLGGT